MIKNASDARVLVASLRDSPDVEFLGQKEGQALGKLLKGLDSVSNGLDKLGVRLEDKK